MGILENPKKYYALAQQMRAMADDEADPFHADRLRRVAIAYEKRAWAMEDQLKLAPQDAGLMVDRDGDFAAPRQAAKLPRMPSRASLN